MKRLFLLIVMLAVGSYTLTSCEKSSNEEYSKPETEQENGNEEGNEEGIRLWRWNFIVFDIILYQKERERQKPLKEIDFCG